MSPPLALLLDSDLNDRSDDAAPIEPLARYVEVEARRRFLDPNAPPDPGLIAAGWERRFVTDLRRAKEMLELYETLGYQTRAEPLRPDELADDCRDCQIAALSFRSIYTRRANQAKDAKTNPEGE